MVLWIRKEQMASMFEGKPNQDPEGHWKLLQLRRESELVTLGITTVWAPSVTFPLDIRMQTHE